MHLPEPHTESQLFDYLNEAFGVGNYDDVAESKPWFKVRMNEIGKLKKMLRARRVAVREMFLAAEYCRSHEIPVKASQELFGHIGPAMLEWRRNLAIVRNRDAATSVQQVIEEAYGVGQVTFAEQLMRADPAMQKRLVDEWRTTYGGDR